MFSSNPFQKLAQGPKKLAEGVKTNVAQGPKKLAEGVKTNVAQGPKKLAEGVKTNVADKIKPSLLTRTKNLITDRIPKLKIPGLPKPTIPNLPDMKIPDLPNIPTPHLPNIKWPSLPKIPMPDLSNLKIPGLPHIPFPHLPSFKIPGLPHIPFPHLPSLKLPHLPKFLSHLLKIVSSIPHIKLILMIIAGAIFGLIALLFIAAAIAGSIYAPCVVLPILGVLLISGIIGLIILVVVFTLWYFFCNDRDITLFVLEYFGKGTRKYSGKVVWLVGASTSLGQAMALELAKAGAKIILSSRRQHILQKLKEDCIEISKGKLSDTDILVLPFAVTEMNEKYVQDVIEQFGKIDVLIDNISHIELGEASKTSIGMDKAIFEVNYFGPIFLIKQVVRHFKETDGGQIIVVSSISGKFGIPGQATSSASKQALNLYFEVLRHECAGHNIYITTVCPGLILSSVTDHSVLVGQSLISQDEQLKMTRNGMKTTRCAHLILVAGANRCTESWVSNQPFLFYIYVAQYYPWIHRLLMQYIFSEKNLQKIYDGKSPNITMWKPQIIVL
ncbi:hypothetical protein JTE90_002243 [Oedothorax gibbosus]|uniref:Dehydrogenase/reductase SDR family member 7 n=1 Tax=Oedothorax gibbosus TaxID=931172 RepID=A0AAV6V711_9ARAC|nr:hypothetical protein JTE90_002243 [Oedothorax gibbosus]